MHVVIPALNEEAALPHVLARLTEALTASVVVVDNGSTDATATVAAQAGAFVVREPARGYGAACLAGIAALARAPDADIVVFLDADGSSDPHDMRRLLAPMAAGAADLVMGSRTLGGAAAVPVHARWGNALALGLIRWRTGVRFTDLGPLRAVRLGVLRGLGMRDRTWGWNIEMQLRAARCGIRWHELPVQQQPRVAGRSKISGSVLGSVRAGCRMLWTALRHGG